ncbi:MAG: SDR family NAD(P)-dependent oxidoreductase [Pseudomonadota bacterium]
MDGILDGGTTRAEPIAIVGIGCRFPGGATDADGYWRFLSNAGCGIVEVPEDRWSLDAIYDPDQGALARSRIRYGGFLSDVYGFDAGFFDISPREVLSMDPQQRMLLSTVYEAVRDAGLRMRDMRAEKTGVFVGISVSDFGFLQRMQRTNEELYAGTGTALCIAANRVSHRYDLSGPSFAVDTACSSSLVAVNQACMSLAHGNCSYALAGGVNALVDPSAFIVFDKAGMLSVTGTISTFDSAANGYVRGEGCGVIVLRRLKDAIADGDRIYSVIRATSVNQDGRTPTLTAPSGERQMAMLETLTARAGIAPEDVDYVEAHGTGTPVGDPIEATAIGRTFGQGRRNGEKVLVGSVKPNIGHLESAAGISGLIKVALAVHHRAVPPNRNFRNPNPNIAFDALGIEVPTSLREIGDGKVARAAVNSFGFGGTNASALVESAPVERARRPRGAARPQAAEATALPEAPLPFVITAAAESSLRESAGRLAAAMAPGRALAGAPLQEIAANLAARDDAHRQRAAIFADTPESLAARLIEVAEDRVPEPAPRTLPKVVMGETKHPGQLAFTFSGQGVQWEGMGRGLLAMAPAFREKVEAFDEIYHELSGISPIHELMTAGIDRLGQPAITQPTILSMQIGLAALWERAGVKPDMIIGHSFGEVAAAHVAGALSLKDTAQLVHARVLMSEGITEPCAMTAVTLGPREMEEYIYAEDRVDIAARNTNTNCTISGYIEDMERVEARLAAERPEVTVKRLAMGIAWHSRVLEPHEQVFRDALGELDWKAPHTPFVSTVSARPETCLDADYWWQNLRGAVAYRRGIETCIDLGATSFLEIGPHRTLSGLTRAIGGDRREQVLDAASLVQGTPELHAIGVAAGQLHAAGHDVDFTAFTGRPSELLDLPAYPWELHRHHEPSEETKRLLSKTPDHPLLGMRSDGAVPVWRNEFTLKSHPWLEDHAVGGDVVFPGAGYVDIMLAAGLAHFGESPLEIEDLEIAEALFIGYEDAILLETSIEPETGIVAIHSHLRDSPAGWVLRARARISQPDVAEPAALALATEAPVLDEPLDRRGFYALAMRHGLNYGAHFQGVERATVHEDGVHGVVQLDEAHQPTHFEEHMAHPALLDAAFQSSIPLATCAAGLPLDVSQNESDVYPLFLPVGTRRIRFFGRLPSNIRVHATVAKGTRPGERTASFVIADETGRAVMTVEGFMTRRMSQESGAGGVGVAPRFYVEHAAPASFEEVAADPVLETGPIHIIADVGGTGAALAERLTAAGASVTLLPAPAGPAEMAETLESIALEESSPATIIAAYALDTPALPDDTPGEALQAAIERNVLIGVALGQKIDALSAAAAPLRLWTLTAGARDLPGATITTRGLAQAPLTALNRTIAGENRGVSPVHLDLRAEDDATLDAAARLILTGTKETELALEGDAAHVFRLEAPEQRTIPMRRVAVNPTGGESTFVATMETPGLIQDIVLEETPAPRPGPGEASIAIGAVGLNFRDIMAATGLLPLEAESEPAWRNLGLEFGGTVLEVGEGVEGLKPGDRVMGMGRRCLQGQIVHPAAGLTPLPDSMSLVDAATVPSAFSTAHYALNHVARIRPGEKVLIHAATGGVGIAAIQLARRAGAEVFATCSAAKRHHLEAMGVEHIFNSRSLDFADEIMERTGGKGVDAVLNSLPGDYIDKGLDCLAPFGRFLEIGKRDVYANAPLGMKALRRNVSLSVIDLAAMGAERPEMLQALSNEVVAMFAAGELTALPATEFPISETVEAFRFMSQAKHIGKVVVTVPDTPVEARLAPDAAFAVREDRSYLITGGSRGFGVGVADYLSRSGAGAVVLASRSGQPDEDAMPTVAAIEARGTAVTHLKLDIEDEAAVIAAVAELASAERPLAGIVHGAAVIRDGFLSQLDEELVTSVLRPKTRGAWNLHVALERAGLPAEHLVMFSSCASTLGSMGQGNYVAANAFLEAFAHWRRQRGLAGQAVCWGAIGDTGFVARNASMASYLESNGLPPVPLEQALEALGASMRFDAPSTTYATIDWDVLSTGNPRIAETPRFEQLARKDTAGRSRIRADLAALPRESWPAQMERFLTEEAAKVLRIDAKEIPADAALAELGFDSLSSMELKIRVEGGLGINAPVSAFLQSPTVSSLAAALADLVEEDMRRVELAQAAEASSAEGGLAHTGEDGASRAMPLTPEQRRILAQETAALTTPAGRLALRTRAALDLPAGVTAEALEGALAALSAAQPVLSLRLAKGGAALEAGEAPVLERVASADAALAAPLDMDGALVRVAVSEADNRLAVVAHRLVLDRGATGRLLDALLEIAGGAEPEAPTPDALAEALAARRFDERRAEPLAAAAHWRVSLAGGFAPVPIEHRRRALLPPAFGLGRGMSAAVAMTLAPARAGGPSGEVAHLVEAFSGALARQTGFSRLALDTAMPAPLNAAPASALGPFECRFPVIVHLAEEDRLAEIVATQIEHGRRHAAFGTAFAEEQAGLDRASATALAQFGLRLEPEAETPGAAAVADGMEAVSAHDVCLTLRPLAEGGWRAVIAYDADVFAEEEILAIAHEMARRAGVPEAGVERLAVLMDTVSETTPAVLPEEVAPDAVAGAGGGAQSFPVLRDQAGVLNSIVSPDCTATLRQAWMTALGIAVKPGLEPSRLSRSFEHLTQRHEALRTRFVQEDGEWRAIVDQAHATGVEVVDGSDIPDDEIAKLGDRFAYEPYDVSTGPLVQVRMIRLGGERGDVLLLRAHHVVSDGWSIIKVTEELMTGYFGAKNETPAPLSTGQLLAREAAERARAAEEAAYWDEALLPIPEIARFGRVRAGTALSAQGAMALPTENLMLDVTGEAYGAIENAARSAKVTVNSALITALGQTMARRGEVDALYISSLHPRRTDPELAEVVNFLATMVPIRVACPDGGDFASAARAVDAQARESYARTHLGFSMADFFERNGAVTGEHSRIVCAALAPEHRARKSSLEPLLQGAGDMVLRIAGLEIRTLPMNARNIVRQELGLRTLVSRETAMIQYTYEFPTFSREEAESILDETLGRLGVTQPCHSMVTRVGVFAAPEDLAAIEAGRLPATRGSDRPAAMLEPAARGPGDR